LRSNRKCGIVELELTRPIHPRKLLKFWVAWKRFEIKGFEWYESIPTVRNAICIMSMFSQRTTEVPILNKVFLSVGIKDRYNEVSNSCNLLNQLSYLLVNN